MAKYDFNLSTYVQLWNSVEGRELISYILSDPNMIRADRGFYREKFEIDPYTIPTAADGTASFTVTARPLPKSSMAHMRAPLGDTIVRQENAAEKYSGSIADFIATGYREQAMEREHKERLAEQLGSDTAVLADWASRIVQVQVDELISSLDNMAAQALSTGKVIYNGGEGIHGPIYKAAIPAANFTTAGAKVWTDPEADLLDYMRAIEKKYKEEVFGLPSIALQWELPYDLYWNVFMKNKQVLQYVKDRILMDKGVQITNPALQYNGDYTRYLSSIDGVSPISVVSEKQYNQGSVVSGWKSGVAVLRPVGYAGKVLHTDILDRKMYEKYGNNAIARTFGQTQNGLFLLMNSVLPNGNMKEWHTDMMMSAVPVLDDFLYHVIVDTTTAD